jgi:hypothetical protein
LIFGTSDLSYITNSFRGLYQINKNDEWVKNSAFQFKQNFPPFFSLQIGEKIAFNPYFFASTGLSFLGVFVLASVTICDEDRKLLL